MKKSLIIALLIVSFSAILISSCTKESADKQTVVPPTGESCDTVNMKYTADIKPILVSRCYGCHGNGNTGSSGGINLDGYSNLLPYVTSGSVKGNITHASGFVGMPFGEAKMDDCTINKILDWINQGAPNN
jgi:hypothetical protein